MKKIYVLAIIGIAIISILVVANVRATPTTTRVKTGTAIIRTSEHYGNVEGADNIRTTLGLVRVTDPIYQTLPKGECSVNFITDSTNFVVYEASDVSSTRNSQSCSGICTKMLNIDDEYYMVRVQSTGSYSYFTIAYKCTQQTEYQMEP